MEGFRCVAPAVSLLLLVACEDPVTSAGDASRDVIEGIPEAQLARTEEIERALEELALALPLRDLLDPAESVALGGEELADIVVIGLEAVLRSKDDEEIRYTGAGGIEKPEPQTAAQACLDLQSDLARRQVACPAIECSFSDNRFRTSIRGGCDGAVEEVRYRVDGAVTAEGTENLLSGELDVVTTFTGYDVRLEMDDAIGPYGSAQRKASEPVVRLGSRTKADGRAREQARGATRGSTDFSTQLLGDVDYLFGFGVEADGRKASGEATGSYRADKRVETHPERATLDLVEAVECEGSNSRNLLTRQSQALDADLTVGRTESADTVNGGGRMGDTGTDLCFEVASSEVSRLYFSAYEEKFEDPPLRLPLRLRVAPRRADEIGPGIGFEEMELPLGRFGFSFEGVVTNPGICPREPVEGTLRLFTSGGQVEVRFDGAARCDGTAPLFIGEAESGSVQGYAFVTRGPEAGIPVDEGAGSTGPTQKPPEATSCLQEDVVVSWTYCPLEETLGGSSNVTDVDVAFDQIPAYFGTQGYTTYLEGVMPLYEEGTLFDLSHCVDPTTRETLSACPLPPRSGFIPLVFGGECHCAVTGSTLDCSACSGVGTETVTTYDCKPDGPCPTARLTCTDARASEHPDRCRLVGEDGRVLLDVPRCAGATTEWRTCSGPDESGHIACACLLR